MKSNVLLILSLILSVNAWAKKIEVTGEPAKAIMAALASSGYEVKGLSGEWSGSVLTIQANKIGCSYNHQYFPDEWMSGAKCENENGKALKESYGLIIAIKEYADSEGAAGTMYRSVNSIDCGLNYDLKAYSCVIDVTGTDISINKNYDSENNCARQQEITKAMIQKDGSVENEEEFLKSAKAAFDICASQYKKSKLLSPLIRASQTTCAQAADQMSQLYYGVCLVKATDLIVWIGGK